MGTLPDLTATDPGGRQPPGWGRRGRSGDHGAMSAEEPSSSGVRAGARTTTRRGRMSDAKREALTTLGPRWQIDPATVADPAALDAAFGRAAPRLLDIGVGTGTATRAWALAHPDHDVVAVELHRPGIARLLTDLDAGGPATVRVVEADVTALLSDARPGCFAAVRVLFPDPWPKRRHVDRRLVDPGFVHRVVDLLPAGGTVHLATDWADYAAQMRAALATDPRLAPRVEPAGSGPDGDGSGDGPDGDDWCSARPPRPATTYEQRGLDAGRTIVDLVARVRPAP